MAVLISDNSPYDRFLKGDQNALSAIKVQGLELFRRDCASCHAEPLTSDFSFKRNGLPGPITDEGRKTISLQNADLGRFKVPSLRNVALSPPYMHDGRMQDLSEVVEHYSNGISDMADPPLPSGGFGYSEAEKTALIEFLNSLTDIEFTENELLSEPN